MQEMYTFMFNRLNIEPELEDMHIKFYKGCIGLLQLDGYAGANQDNVFEEVGNVISSCKDWHMTFIRRGHIIFIAG